MVWCYAGAASLQPAGYVTEREDRAAGGPLDVNQVGADADGGRA